jgi:hypothetical protein
MKLEYERIAEVFDPTSFDPDFNIRQPALRAGKRRKGADYVRYMNEVGPNGGKEPYRLERSELEEKAQVLESFKQNDRAFEVFIPSSCLRGFFDQVMRGDLPQGAYKGVSYNPNLIRDGEKLGNLDFFSWARRVQSVVPDFELTVLDASPYQVINEMGNLVRYPGQLQPYEFEEWFYGMLEKGVSSNGELAENCEIRNRYLKAMLEVSGVKGRVVSALDLIKDKDPQLIEALRTARFLCGVDTPSGGIITVDKAVDYRRYNGTFAKTYTPAVVAEALYFLSNNGIKAKLGPTSEVAFDKLIGKMMRRETDDYNFFWYNRPFEKQGRRDTQIYFGDSEDDVNTKLAKDEGYRNWVSDIVEDMSDESRVEDMVADVSERVMALAA